MTKKKGITIYLNYKDIVKNIKLLKSKIKKFKTSIQ